MPHLEAIKTFYGGVEFRSRLEARWAVFLDTLDEQWVYEPQHYDLGFKHMWSPEDDAELEDAINSAWDDDERDELRRDAWRQKNERRLYLPDFFLIDRDAWLEIKGRDPTHEERIKARKLWERTRKPVHLLWGYPPTVTDQWGKNADVFGGEFNIIALMVIDYGTRSIEKALHAARQARFEHGERGRP